MKSLLILLVTLIAVSSISTKTTNLAHQTSPINSLPHLAQGQSDQTIPEHKSQDTLSNHYQSSSPFSQQNITIKTMYGCSKLQDSTIDYALSICGSQPDIKNSALCITKTISSRIKQYWSVFIKENDQAGGYYIDVPSGCTYLKQNVGNSDRTVYLWPRFDYNNQHLYWKQIIPIHQNILRNPCSEDKNKQIRELVSECNFYSDLNQKAKCINEKLQSKYNENWNVIIETTTLSAGSTKKWNSYSIYYHLKTCHLQFQENLYVYNLWQTAPKIRLNAGLTS